MYQSWALMELTMLTDMSVNCFVATDDSPNSNYNLKHSVICLCVNRAHHDVYWFTNEEKNEMKLPNYQISSFGRHGTSLSDC